MSDAQRPVAEDAELAPAEKQVSITTTKDSEECTVHSEVASVTRYLLAHPAADVTDTREREGTVVACTARVPIGLVKLGVKPRKSDHFGQMVSSGTLRDRGESDE